MKKILSLLIIGLLCLSMLSALSSRAMAVDTVLSVDPASIIDPALVPGSTFRINITVANVQNLAGFQFILRYSTIILTATDYGFYPPIDDPSPSRIDDTAGYVDLAATLHVDDWGSGGVTTVSSVPIVWIEFIVDDLGASRLDLYNSLLGNILAKPISHTEVDGLFSAGIGKCKLTVHVEDATNNNPISGANVAVAGPESRSGVTDGAGWAVYYDLPISDYDVAVSASGYHSASESFILDKDTTIEIRLTPIITPGTLDGTVTDAATSSPIAGATIKVNGKSAITDVLGQYEIALDPGAYDVSVEMTGYTTQTVTGVLIIQEATTTQDFALNAIPAPPGKPEVLSTDLLGNSESKFQLSEEVFVKGTGFTADCDVVIYIIPDRKETLASNAVATSDAKTGDDGSLPNTLVWKAPLTPGNYDIWVDTNKNGVYDAGDALNGEALGVYSFFVVAESSVIASIVGMFAALATFSFIKKRRRASSRRQF